MAKKQFQRIIIDYQRFHFKYLKFQRSSILQYKISITLNLILHIKKMNFINLKMQDKIPRLNKFVFSIMPIFGCLASMTMGYFIVYLTMLDEQLALYHNYTIQEAEFYYTIMTAALPVGAFLGSFVYSHFIDTYGQKKSMVYMDCLAIFAMILQIISIYFPVVCVSRLLMGFYCAIITGVVPSWIVSMTPSFTNGIFGTFNQIAFALGIAQAYFMGQFLQNNSFIQDLKLKIYIGLPIVTNLVHLFGLRYLGFDNIERLIEKRQNMEVMKFMRTIYGPKWKEFQKQVRQFKMNPVEIQPANAQQASETLQQEKKLQEDNTCQKKVLKFKQSLCCYSKNWESTKLSIMLAVANQLSGVLVIFEFSKQIFVKVEEDFAEADTSLLFLGLFQVLITFASGFFINKFGRRPMMLIGQTIIVISLLVCAIVTLAVERHEIITIICIFIYFFGYSISLGPLFMLYAIQTYSNVGLIVKIYWGLMVVLTLVTDYLIQQISISIMFFIFFACSIISFIYFSKRMVETKDKSRKEIRQLIEGNTFLWEKSDMLFTQSTIKKNNQTAQKSLGTI